MLLVKLQLFSKNNLKNGFYLYCPIVKIEDKFFWCKSIKTNRVTKTSEINTKELQITREIPPEYYEANGLI